MTTLIEQSVQKFFDKAKAQPTETFSLSLGGVPILESTRKWIVKECPPNVVLGADLLEEQHG